MRGAKGQISVRGCGERLQHPVEDVDAGPRRACSSAPAMSAGASPSILMSIWSAVMPLRVPATLKSMSP